MTDGSLSRFSKRACSSNQINLFPLLTRWSLGNGGRFLNFLRYWIIRRLPSSHVSGGSEDGQIENVFLKMLRMASLFGVERASTTVDEIWMRRWLPDWRMPGITISEQGCEANKLGRFGCRFCFKRYVNYDFSLCVELNHSFEFGSGCGKKLTSFGFVVLVLPSLSLLTHLHAPTSLNGVPKTDETKFYLSFASALTSS